jgi:phenylalanyl-tRNA synthetase beta chain
MKFSYTLLKNLVPKLPEKVKFIEKFNFHAFEAEDVGGDTIEISIPANRYSDAGSHWGIAKIAAAILGTEVKYPKVKEPKIELKNTQPEIKIAAKKECPRYLGRYFEVSRMLQSPQWMREILLACGMRPINAVVDVMNYVMLEVGQPLHAFDAELVVGGINVRSAKNKEEIRTIEGIDYKLDPNNLVIADEKGPLAIAGIKGGKRAEINLHTKKIIVEAASFDPVSVYRTARQLNLFTDASSRFSHGLVPLSAELGMQRATQLLKEVAQAKIGELNDVNYSKPTKTVLKFDIGRFNDLTGLNLSEKTALEYLKSLGFKVKGKEVEAPETRTDIVLLEDLAEEIVNLYGYEKLPDKPPHVPITPAKKEEQVLMKEKTREILRGFGMSEVYNYSFVSRKDLVKYADPKWWGAVALLNPVSADFHYLRPNLGLHLLRNLDDNLRFYDEVRIFEIGKSFTEKKDQLEENLMLGMAAAYKKGNPILELKGMIEELFEQLGLVDYFFRDLESEIKFLEEGSGLQIESDHEIIGFIGTPKAGENFAIAELDFGKLAKLVEEEKEYEPLPKYPSVMRDVSLFVPKSVRVNEILEVIENAAPKYLDDADLVDFYEDPSLKADRKSLTFRLIFQAEDHTLTTEEIGEELGKIISALQDRFDAEIR